MPYNSWYPYDSIYIFLMKCWKIFYQYDINWVVVYDRIDSISKLIYAGTFYL